MLVFMLAMAVDEGDLDVNPPKTAANPLTPTIPSPFLHPIPIPPSTLKTETMSRYNRNFKVTTEPPTQLRVQRTRNDTPHPYLRTSHLTPAYEPGDDRPDAIDIVVTTATAGTILDVAKEIRLAVAARAKTDSGRAKLLTEIKRNSSGFYHYIGMHDILKRTINSANDNAAGASGSQPATAKSKAPKPAKGKAPVELWPETTLKLTNLIRDLLAVSQLGAAILRSQYQTPSSSNATADPRIHLETHEINDFDFERLMESMNGNTVVTSVEELTVSTKNETTSEDFETINAPIEEHAE